jgi:hypothetical protein
VEALEKRYTKDDFSKKIKSLNEIGGHTPHPFTVKSNTGFTAIFKSVAHT